jgi:hypothetical protein
MEKATGIWYFGLTWGEQGRVQQWLARHKPPADWKWSALDFAFLRMPNPRTPDAEKQLAQSALRKKFQIEG